MLAIQKRQQQISGAQFESRKHLLVGAIEQEGGKLLEENGGLIKFALGGLRHQSEEFEIFLTLDLTQNCLKVAARSGIAQIWKKILSKGLLTLHKFLGKINLENKDHETFVIKQAQKVLECKGVFPTSQASVLVRQFVKSVISNCHSATIALYQYLESQQDNEILKKIEKCKTLIEYTRAKRYKSTNKSYLHSKEQLRDDKALKGCIKDRQKLHEKLKNKMKKQSNVLRCFKQIKIEVDNEWKKKTGNNESLQKCKVTFEITAESSMNKKTTEFLASTFESKIFPSDSQESQEQQEKAPAAKIMYTKELVKKCETKQCLLSFSVQKKILAHLRFSGCSSINQYYCEQVDSLNSFKEFYSQFHQNQVNSCPLTAKSFLKVIQTLCEGLFFFKEHGISHRDLKPDNILLSKSFTSKIIDFGSACHNKYCRLISPDLKIISHQLFTTHYYNMHYEELPKEVKKAFRSCEYENHYLFDMYAFGIVLRDLLKTGSLAWEMGDLIWENIACIAEWCQEKNPDDRPDPQDLYVLLVEIVRYFQN